MKSLKKMIQKVLPYHHYRRVVIVFTSLFLIMIAITIGISFIKVEPIMYDQKNIYDYMYVDVEDVYDASSNYYIATDNQYVYIYYSDSSSQEVLSEKTLNGVPKKISDQDLENILPSFQKHFSQLNVKNTNEMKEYIGLYALDHTLPQLHSFVVIVGILSLIPLFIAFIYLAILLYHYKKMGSSLVAMEKKNKVEDIKQQLTQPIHIFSSLRIALLRNYLVINRPIPYVINYEDIQWVYLEKKRFLFMFDREINLVIHNTHFKRTKVLYASSIFKKNKEETANLMEYIESICPSVLIGYNVENRQTYYSRKHNYEKNGA